MSQETEVDHIASHNELKKLMGTTLNTVGLGIVGFGVVQPLISGTIESGDVPRVILCVFFCLAFHVMARNNVQRLHKEKK
ncbi:hypothetical protein [Paracoccus litorisediminis]|uniref:Amino acid permease n=1 Tax=Paracoccus litorisediminis TaxID=2006130 RepID=A0A844HU50_9RHOB|nr:hypothetical protein [Paracoccus litorisediminis]MTH61101.1 hypothetical protein [Paracoccus litorisediminis]